MTKYPYFVSGNAPVLYPTETFFGNLMWSEDDGISVPYSYPFAANWGESVSMHIYDEKEFPVPSLLDMIWFSIVENQFYSIEEKLPAEKMEELFQQKDVQGNPLYDYIIVGMAPFGNVAVWLAGARKQTEVAWLKAVKTDVEMEDFCPSTNLNREEYAETVLKNAKEAYDHFQANGLPNRMLYENYMARFNYKIHPLIEDEIAELQGMDIWYYNGEFDTLMTDEYSCYAMRAKPRKMVAHYKVGKAKYKAFIWFDDVKTRMAFSDFYGENSAKEMELVIDIRKSNKEFHILMSGDDSSQPKELPQENVEILVFKNKFESYRNDNYDRPSGGWRK